jgi:hypothetical protein
MRCYNAAMRVYRLVAGAAFGFLLGMMFAPPIGQWTIGYGVGAGCLGLVIGMVLNIFDPWRPNA